MRQPIPPHRDPKVQKKRRLFAFLLLAVFAAFIWALDAHQKRINEYMAEAEVENLPTAAERVADLQLRATRECNSIGEIDLERCKLRRQSAASQPASLAGLTAEFAISGSEYFLARCQQLRVATVICEGHLKTAFINMQNARPEK